MIMRAAELWYKNAIFYELHLRAFADSNADGVGDFRGAIEKLDYLQELGVTGVWLLPFYPSPRIDDGYDVADYCQVHPEYGTLEDCRAFLAAAHARGIRVLIDLVVNHTSDQHPWFQEARSSPTSPKRGYYVWSDTPDKYAQARIIFKDFEASNWAWDPVAGAYYWHRFFRQQPDLNYDNPQVQQEMLQVVRFWLKMGIDGFRCDAVPYLFEREGTLCEGLPETHAYFKELRREIERTHPECLLLGEANHMPRETAAYFGDGDEFHMAFLFAIVPRLFLALAQESCQSLVEVLAQLPSIPATGQWATFLRNHDEMTFSRLTTEERETMYRAYARDFRARLNTGVRRRLAPFVENDRRKIELLYSVVFSLPGSPVLYYGDEIGMGDNLLLPDRQGLRTPMQWNDSVNAGFSAASPDQLYTPVICDSIFGFQVVNVESQRRDPTSLFHWLRRLIKLRKQHQEFGYGSLTLLDSPNTHVVAYLRQSEEKSIAVVANFSAHTQSITLDVTQFRGATLIDILQSVSFPPIMENRYSLTLDPYQSLWLRRDW